ncbi:hypothetical protein Daus18300_002705 [Diaporthe australafricana]|uniref:Uncharacterized protein n=1 Tax=Diaporthe australafricana TaxID=127596 RepID=A0ABR3XL45_9PEZI
MSSNNTNANNGNQNGNTANNEHSSTGHNGNSEPLGAPQTNGHVPTFADMPRSADALETWRRNAYPGGNSRDQEHESSRDARN